MILNFLKKHGPLYSTYIFTMCILVVTMSISYFTMLYFQDTIYFYQILLPTLVPLIIFPVPAYSFFKLHIKLEQAEKDLKQKNSELEISIKEIKVLKGLFPICSSCKNIRDKDGEWSAVERYIEKKSDATFSHSLCPSCVRKLYPDLKKNDSSK